MRNCIAATIFGAIAEAGINIDMIVQNVSAAETAKTDISFTLPEATGRRPCPSCRASSTTSPSRTFASTTASARSPSSARG